MRGARGVIVALTASTLMSGLALIGVVRNTVRLVSANRQAIQRSNYNTCIFVRSIIFSFHTPQGQRNAQAIIQLNPALMDCKDYAKTGSVKKARLPAHGRR